MANQDDFLRKELIKDLKRLYKQRGNKRPRTIDVQNDRDRPNYATYIKYFGSWGNALKEAGVDKDGI
ncbi:MAG: hypothetical protein NT076_05225 [Candidatus Pacearchaeota archaeon]|nr:hypothetical protein [Candidatus Pacearchaeota archaeon]